MDQQLEQRVANLIEPAIQEKGLELVNVEYIKEGAHRFLRIYIDKEGGVDLDDCSNISHVVSELLDKNDPIPQAYMLEVSSPGIERPLKKKEDFERFKGKLVFVKTNERFQGYQEFTGYLVGLIDNEIVLEYEGELVKIPQIMVEKANLTFEF